MEFKTHAISHISLVSLTLTNTTRLIICSKLLLFGSTQRFMNSNLLRCTLYGIQTLYKQNSLEGVKQTKRNQRIRISLRGIMHFFSFTNKHFVTKKNKKKTISNLPQSGKRITTKESIIYSPTNSRARETTF